ncbi:MAG: DNA polymerase IV [Chloroflexia bacterium]
MGARVILCLDMDAFFVSVERSLRPELEGKPVVVGGHLEGRGVVSSASYEARAYGIHAAMPLTQARRLCPHAIFLPGRFDLYRQASRQVRSFLEGLSPWVEMASIDEAFVDLTGSERTLGDPFQVARDLQERIRRELHLPCSIGLAGNKLVAKVACSRAKPAGLLQVPIGQEAAFLAPLPITVLPGIGPHTAARLAELRLTTCAELAAAPAGLLERILGPHAPALQRRARGEDRSPVSPCARPVRSISRAVTFSRDSRDLAFLRATLCLLVEEVGYALRRNGLGCHCITVQVRWANFSTQSRQQTLPHPTASDAALLRVTGDLLDDLLDCSRQRIRLLGVQVSRLILQGMQLPLLPSDRLGEERALRLSRCLDQIRSRYGSRSIQRGSVWSHRKHLGELEESGWNAFQPP